MKIRTLSVEVTCLLYEGRPRLLRRLRLVLRGARLSFCSAKIEAAIQGALGGVHTAGKHRWAGDGR